MLPALCILSAFCTLLFQYDGSTVITLASSQFMLWASFHVCVAMPFFLSSLLTAPLCSISLLYKVLFVSPMYTFSQSRQGTSYTTLFFRRSGLGVLTSISFSCSVWCELKTTLTPMRLHTLCIHSDSPWQYGRDRIFDFSSHHTLHEKLTHPDQTF